MLSCRLLQGGGEEWCCLLRGALPVQCAISILPPPAWLPLIYSRGDLQKLKWLRLFSFPLYLGYGESVLSSSCEWSLHSGLLVLLKASDYIASLLFSHKVDLCTSLWNLPLVRNKFHSVFWPVNVSWFIYMKEWCGFLLMRKDLPSWCFPFFISKRG